MLHKTLLFTVCCGLLIAGYQLPTTLAQASPLQVIFTWQANNFYPSNYPGKAAAASNSPLIISISLVKGGTLQDLSQTSINWYVDGQFFKRGVGLDTVSLTNQKLRGDSYFIRALIPAEGDGGVEGVLSIPTGEQVVVIEAPFPRGTVSRGETSTIQATPYFFNIKAFNNLTFFWEIDGRNQKNERGNQLTLQIGSSLSLINKTLLVSVSVGNSSNPIESARSYIRLLVE